MCRACKSEDHPEVKSVSEHWAGFEAANYLVTGFTCCSGGVMATTKDEFTARRLAIILKRHGFDAAVKPNNDESANELNENIMSLLNRLRPNLKR